jgi:hypothetical protein
MGAVAGVYARLISPILRESKPCRCVNTPVALSILSAPGVWQAYHSGPISPKMWAPAAAYRARADARTDQILRVFGSRYPEE